MVLSFISGKSGTNDLGHTYSVVGIGIDNADKLVWRTERYILQQVIPPNEQNISFDIFRTATINVTRDLFCDNSNEVKSVTNAWYAVGVGTAYNESLMGISGGEPVCSNQTYSLVNQPSGKNKIWTSSNPSGLSINSSSGYASRQGTFNGWVTIYATVNESSGNPICITIVSRQVWVGRFNQTVVTGESVVCPDSYYWHSAQVPGGDKPNYYYDWSFPGNWILQSLEDDYRIFLKTPINNPQYGTLRVQILNQPCGPISEPSGITVYPNYNCGHYFVYYPNPVNGELNIESVSTFEKPFNEDSLHYIFEVDFKSILYNPDQKKVKEADSNNNKIVFDVHDLIPGLYYLHIISNNEIIKEEIIIK